MIVFVRRQAVGAVLASVLLVGSVCGCYTSRPIDTPVPAVGQHVVLRLSEQGAVDMAPEIGPRMESVEGTVVSAEDGRLQLRMSRTEERNGTSTLWNGENIAFPRGAVASVRERSLDRRRTALFAGGLSALAITLGILLGTGVIGGNGGDSDAGPQ